MPSKLTDEIKKILQNPDFDFIQGPAQARMLSAQLRELGKVEGFLGVDTETTGLDPRVNQVRLIQVATRDYALLIDLDGWRPPGERAVPWEAPGLRELKTLLEGSKPKVLQNAAFDLNFLRGEKIVLGGPLFDTMVAAKLINNGLGAKNDLGAIVQRVLKVEIPKELQKSDWSAALSGEQLSYAARDGIALVWLEEVLSKALQDSKVPALRREVTLYEVFKLEMSVLRPIALMQWHGFGFNAVGAAALQRALEAKAEGLKAAFLEVLDAEIQRRSPENALPRDADGSFNTRERDSGSIRKGTKLYAGFNPRSPQQMAARMQQAGIILPPDEKGTPSLDQNLLAFLKKDYPLISQYLEWKESVTLVSAVEKLLESIGPDGRIHAGYRQMGAETGRLSCIAEGQRVLAPNGPIPIEDVQVGDYVYSLDSDGAPCVKQVTNKWCNGEQDVVCVTWEAKGHQDPMYGELVCTPDHLLRTDRGWVKAEDIQFKEPVWHLRRSAPAGRRPRLYYGIKRSNHRVINVAPAGKAVVYDLEIEDTHNFIVEELCVHNCAGPNLQQVPRDKEFRSLFTAAEGYTLVVADFSQVELRVAAELSGEERMRAAYAAGRDLHTETAALIAGVSSEEVTKAQRQSAKVCFSLDTEVLTLKGWTSLACYRGEDVAQYTLPSHVELNPVKRARGAGSLPPWNGADGAIEFVPPIHYETFYSDNVLHAAHSKYDIKATSNHNILYLDQIGRAILRPFSDVRFPQHFVVAGKLVQEPKLSELESRFLAAVVADGSFKLNPNILYFNFKKQRKIDRLRMLLGSLGLAFKEFVYECNDGFVTRFAVPMTSVSWLLDYTSVDKELNPLTCLLDLNKLAYLDEARYWDGAPASKSGNSTCVKVCTTVEQTADIMQAIAAVSGVKATLTKLERPGRRTLYTLYYSLDSNPVIMPRLSWAPKAVEPQAVGCVQVPSGLLLVRRNGKVTVQGNCNFGLLYGAGPATLRKQAVAQYGIDMELDEAKELVEGFRTAYPDLYKWQQTQGSKTTVAVNTATGRRRMLVGFNDRYTTRINTQVQGSSGDIAKIAIWKLWKHITQAPEGEALLIAMVHDEIVLEVREERAEKWAALLKDSMESAGALVCAHVPIVAEVSSGATWAEAK